MTLTAADVAEIMRLVEQSQFDHLSLEMDGIKLSLSRSGVPPGPQIAHDAPVPEAASPVPEAASPLPADSPASLDAGVAVTAPMLGTFYRSPKPGAAPFVEVGSAVTEETVIGIIEVMKLMNTVRSGVAGVVTDIVLKDETLVEFGTVLMRVRPDA